ncbi:hypothetical protein COCVIDRAFT_108220, partial [Bipolaris victoriae FI3]
PRVRPVPRPSHRHPGGRDVELRNCLSPIRLAPQTRICIFQNLWATATRYNLERYAQYSQ